MKKTAMSLILFMALAAGSNAQNFTVNKTVQQCFAAQKNAEINIDNKYGNVIVEPSVNDSVCVKVDIMVTDKNLVEANEQLNEISVAMQSSGYFISVATSFDGNRNDFKTDWKMITGSVFSTSKEVKVNYTVSIPQGLSLSISNSYGDIIIADHQGGLNIHLNNGNLLAGNLYGKTTLTLTGGKARCHFLSNAIVNADMVEFQADSIENTFFDTRASQITILSSCTLSVDSRRDKWFINQVTQLSGSGNFSSFTIGNLTKDCNMNTYYGNLTLSKIDTGFHSINLITVSSDVSMALPAGVTPQFSCDQKKTRVILPARLNLKTDTLDEKTQQYHTANVVENASSFVNLNVSSGSVSVY